MNSSAAGTNGSDIPPHPVLREALIDKKVQHPDGTDVTVAANINAANSMALYRTICERKPEIVIEIGMAYGVSTLSILTAMEEVGHGRLISIDPYIDWPTGQKIALHQVERAGCSHRHEHRQECSYTAIIALMSENIVPQLVYIDGNHNFDYAFVDFFLSDKLLPEKGIMAFNDSGWRSVFRVIRFLQRYRRYEELDVGLASNYAARNPVFSLIKRLQGRDSNDRYFEKLEDWEPSADRLTIPGP